MGIFKKNAFGITIFLDFIYDFFFRFLKDFFQTLRFALHCTNFISLQFSALE